MRSIRPSAGCSSRSTWPGPRPHLPQIRAAFTSSDGAHGVSTLTWGYFALSHLTGALSSLDVARDPKLFGAFLGNFGACSVLLGVVVWRRHRQTSRRADLA
jgi:hypothetical protein